VIVCAQKAQKNDKLTLEEDSKVYFTKNRKLRRLCLHNTRLVGFYKMERNFATLRSDITGNIML
jgi:hypothetical protein